MRGMSIEIPKKNRKVACSPRFILILLSSKGSGGELFHGGSKMGNFILRNDKAEAYFRLEIKGAV